MSIEFSGRWNHYSWSAGGHTDQESERQLILEMIRNCNSSQLKRYADSTSGGSVYVRTGIHTSKKDNREHVHVQLGDRNSKTWHSATWPGYTAHIYYSSAATGGYDVSMVKGLHSGSY